MSSKEFVKLEDAMLLEKEAELRKQLFDLRIQSASDKIKDVSQVGKIRRDIARVETVLRQRQLAAGKAQA
ncbi:MAG: 50S ribosomal protein L29 [Phycisphaerae bacterium]